MIALPRTRRKKTLVTVCLSSVILLCILSDRREEHNLKQYQFYDGQYTKINILKQNETSLSKCDKETVIISSKLDARNPWKQEPQCLEFTISHMVPKCREPTALASYPGSGNTWLRYLIEGATGFFTGSRYKDLQIQMYGLWGEIRNWEDGTTIVQKTHDANQHHVQVDFKGRAILILRNPYDAILSTHNFMYAGHHGRAPARNFARPDWHRYVTIQADRWLDMASNWTIHSSSQKVLVVHYENVKHDLLNQMRRILSFFHLPIDEDRLQCLLMHKDGLFHRDPDKTPEVVPFNQEIRKEMDKMIDHVNQKILIKRGYDPMPLHLYSYYQKSNEEILDEIKKKNHKIENVLKHRRNQEEEDSIKKAENALKKDRGHGTKMVLEQYIKWLDLEDENFANGADANASDGAKSKVMKELFKKFRQNSGSKTLTGLSEKAEGILSKAVELWPILQRPFAKDPIEDAIETDGSRGHKISDLFLPS